MRGRIIGLLIVMVAMYFGALLAAGDASVVHCFLLDTPSLAMVAVGTLGLSILAFRRSSWRHGVNLLYGKCPQEYLNEAVAFWNGSAFFALLVGIVATLIGIIIFYVNLNDVSLVFRAFAITLVPMVYGLLLFALCKAISIGTRVSGK